MTLQYYRSTGFNGPIKPIQSKHMQTNDMAYLALAIIREEGEISRKKLTQKLELRLDDLKYSKSNIGCELEYIMSSLSAQGLVEILSFRQFVANGNLTRSQIYNYVAWLRYSGIIQAHGHSNVGEYPQIVLNILRKIGNYKATGMTPVKAITASVREEMGEDKERQFYEWHKRRVSELDSKMKEHKRSKRAELLKRLNPLESRISDKN